MRIVESDPKCGAVATFGTKTKRITLSYRADAFALAHELAHYFQYAIGKSFSIKTGKSTLLDIAAADEIHESYFNRRVEIDARIVSHLYKSYIGELDEFAVKDITNMKSTVYVMDLCYNASNRIYYSRLPFGEDLADAIDEVMDEFHYDHRHKEVHEEDERRVALMERVRKS